MKVTISGATFRRLIPAGAVAAVLAFSYMAQAPTLASNNDVGYGYRNNCGVKGDGFHDHGKVCPNRPFPGQGHGLTVALSNGNTPVQGNGKAKTNSNPNATREVNRTTASVNSDNATNPGNAHSRSRGKAWGRSHRKT